MKSMISTKIRNYRTQLGLSQDALAEKLGVTAQAVSKWECAQAYPDIELLPELAAIFHIAIDDLFYEKTEQADTHDSFELPLDGVLRIVQIRDGKVLSAQEYDPENVIQLWLQELTEEKKLEHIEVWGSVSVDGDINGNVTAGHYVECGDVGGDVKSNGYVECGDVDGNVTAGGNVDCGDVGENVSAGGNVECDDVGGDVIHSHSR